MYNPHRVSLYCLKNIDIVVSLGDPALGSVPSCFSLSLFVDVFEWNEQFVERQLQQMRHEDHRSYYNLTTAI